MATLDLSSSFSGGFFKKYFKDATKSQLGSDCLAESWPMSFMQSALSSSKESLQQSDKLATSCCPSPASSPGLEANDLHSLAWLQRDHILDIAPLDDDDNFNKPADTNKYLEKNNNWPAPSKNVEKVNVAEMLQNMSQYKCATSSPHTYHTHPGSSFPQQDCSTSSSGGRRPPKPAYSYTHLIYMAIESSAHKCRTVNQIYTWCETHFPYFRTAGPGWKNSLRHNLSINKSFKRIPRDGRSNEETDSSDLDCNFIEGPGRGAYWTVVPSERLQLLEAVKRNPWTYRAGLASIPGLLPTLQPQLAADLKRSPGKTSAMGYSSASEEPASSRASDADSDSDSAIEAGEDCNDETAVYSKILRRLEKDYHKSQKSLNRPCKHSKSADKENKPNIHDTVSEINQVDATDETDSNCGPLDLSMNSSEFKNIDKFEPVSDKALSPERNADLSLGPLEIIAPEPNQMPIEVKTDVSSPGNELSSLKDSPPCEKCLERRRRAAKRRSLTASKNKRVANNSISPLANSSPIKRRSRPCYFTPAPNYDHEYAMCQAQLHPPTNFSDDEEETDMDDGNHTEPMSQPADLEDLADIPSDSEMNTNESAEEKRNLDDSVDSLEDNKETVLTESKRSMRNLVKDIDQNFNRRKRLSNPRSFKPIGWTRGTSWQRPTKRPKLSASIIAAK